MNTAMTPVGQRVVYSQPEQPKYIENMLFKRQQPSSRSSQPLSDQGIQLQFKY